MMKMTVLDSYKALIGRMCSSAHPCKNGHSRCSDSPGGACSDEVLAHLSEEERRALEDRYWS